MSPQTFPAGPVLVVDDDPEVLDAYELMLSASGLEVRTARNAREAMARVKEEAIPVCLVDLHLGETDGIQLCVELRAWNPTLRSIIITAYPAYDSAVSALKLGIVDYLSKAEAPSRILDKVKETLLAHAEEQSLQIARETHGTGVVISCACGTVRQVAGALAAHHPAYDLRVCPDLSQLPQMPELPAQAILLCQTCTWPSGPMGAAPLVQGLALAPSRARILLLNCDLGDDVQLDLLEAGVRGFLPAGTEPETLLEALDVVLRDHYWISRSLTARVLSRLLPPKETLPPMTLENPLSPREIEILRALTEGLSNQEIGDRLFISESTVKIHVHRIFRKLGVKSRTQALLRTMELRLV